jgi:hypothetical protein
MIHCPPCEFASVSHKRTSSYEDALLRLPRFSILVVILAAPRVFGCWQVGPIFFARQPFPRRFAIRPRQKHSEHVVGAIYRVEAVLRFRWLVVNNLEKRIRRSSPALTFFLGEAR